MSFKKFAAAGLAAVTILGQPAAAGLTAYADAAHPAPKSVKMVSPNGKTGSVQIKWSKIPSATKYIAIIGNTNSKKAIQKVTTSSPKATFKNLASATEYQVMVYAVYSDNKANGSKTIRVGTAPKAPSTFKVTNKTYYSATLTWKAVSGAKGYHIYGSGKNSDVETRTTKTSAELRKFIKPGQQNVFYIRSKIKLSTGTVIYSGYQGIKFKAPSVAKTLPVTPINQLGMNGGVNGYIYATCGCGPAALTMVINGDKGLSLSKDEALKVGYQNGYCYNVTENFRGQIGSGYVGCTLENLKQIASAMGYTAELDHMYGETKAQVLKKIDAKIDSGHRLVVGHLMSSGVNHFATCYGRDYNGNYLVVDPWGGYTTTWTRDQMYNKINGVNVYSTPYKYDRGILWVK